MIALETDTALESLADFRGIVLEPSQRCQLALEDDHVVRVWLALLLLADSDGMVGLNFAVAFLRDDGRMIEDVPLEQMLRHLDYLIEHLGEDRVGLGSDYDGAIVPQDVTTVADLPNLRQAMTQHGYDDALMTKLCHENWLRVLEKTWGY